MTHERLASLIIDEPGPAHHIAASEASVRNGFTPNQENPSSKEGHRSGAGSDDLTELRQPTANDGAQVHGLIAICKPLDLNSTYAYLLLCHHYAETCVIAQSDDRVTGFISGYIPPQAPDTLFVWQVAVHPDARGAQLGVHMLTHLLTRDSLARTRFLETTVSPSNAASRRMFQRFAEKIVAPIEERMFFDRAAFGGEDHEEEVLLKIGPFAVGATGKETT